MNNKNNKYIRNGKNIKSILQSFASENKINVLSLDYSLISYKTYIIKDSDIRVEIDNIDSYIDTNYTITQDYIIEVFLRKSSFYPILIQVQSNDNNTELKALIYTQRIPQHGNLEEIIYNTILNICAYRDIIINLGWNDLKSSILEIVNKMKGSEVQPEYYTIDISKLKEPSIKKPAVKLIISKNKTNSILSHDSLLLNGGFFRVTKGETLLDYKKPVYDSMWRNVYGNIYGVGLYYPIGIEAGDGIKVEQEDDKIIFKAELDGYVSIVGGVMIISDTIVLDNINSKNATNIKEQGINSLIIKNETLIRDAIPSGISLNIDNLKITGNIGAVDITSKNLFINGQVHIKSNLKAKKAQILNLKGKLIAKEAEIRYCENANIECDNISINYLNGSKIYFTNGRIFNIQSNNMLFVQNKLSVMNIIGENNEFILYPCLYGEQKEILDSLNNKLLNINRLNNIFILDKNIIYTHKNNNELIYKNLEQKNLASIINTNLYNWQEIINQYKDKASYSSLIFDKFNSLLEDITQKRIIVSKSIKSKQEEMFNIEIIFENKCSVGFYIRFINFYGAENRYHINANKNNMIKKVKLLNKDNNIKIICYKE
ncbi:hypothetical protein [Helicobacter sp. MIT 14-3879]|uniref:hypothetical protein n=1 Tax=Helicobacter sp. MIT 14-3879 TaxID=2040649 RepID=UPI000E1F4CF7|nr:hypothetical protein [Helicobacter sp. MIT 14-3879]RDU63129.1 hypothetical protein CQA44_05675 [Helicobacter sp. MIT 14-3879]